MKPSRGKGAWIPGVAYVIGLTVGSVFLLLSGLVIQYDWRLRMDNITLFFGQATASPEQIALLFGLTLSFSAAVVSAFEAVHRRRGWLIVLAGFVISLPLIITNPLIITYSIVWSGVAIKSLIELTTDAGGLATVGATFLMVLGVNTVLWTFLFWDSSRNLGRRVKLFVRRHLEENEE